MYNVYTTYTMYSLGYMCFICLDVEIYAATKWLSYSYSHNYFVLPIESRREKHFENNSICALPEQLALLFLFLGPEIYLPVKCPIRYLSIASSCVASLVIKGFKALLSNGARLFMAGH